MTTISIDTPYTFTYAIQTLMRNILEKTCQKHLPFTDCDTFVEAVFKSFIAEGADIIKQLVAIKQNANHDIFKDHQCKQALQQNWFLFINQCINFGRATPASNGIFTDDDQLTHEDPKGVDFTKCFDNFLYKEILDIRGIPTKGPGLANAIKIRHDLAKLIIQHFVQPTFTNQLISLKDLVEHNDYLLKENLELKRSTLEPAPKPAPKRHKPNGDSEDLQTNADSDSVAKAFVQAVAEAVEERVEEEPEKRDAETFEEALEEEGAQGAEATEEEAADQTLEEALEEINEQTLEEALEQAVEEEGAQGAEATEDTKDNNPWVEICEQHNAVMSKINPKIWEKKNKVKIIKDFFKKLDKNNDDMYMSLVRAIRDSSTNVDSNIWDEPLFSDVTDEEPDVKTFEEITGTFCTIIKNNWEKIQEALHSAK